MNSEPFFDQPQSVFVIHADSEGIIAARRNGGRWSAPKASLLVRPARTAAGDPTLNVTVHCPNSPIARVGMRWHVAASADALFLADHWERGYGDLQWRPMQPERLMPWYFAAHTPADGTTVAIGVRTGPAAFCAWTIDPQGVTLWVDLRNGGLPSIPGDRSIDAAAIVAIDSFAGERPFAVIRRLCARMCDHPRLAPTPVCGSNNWYYAYGQNFDAAQVLRDAALLARLAGNHEVRPYCVVDAGWSPGGVCPGGPWTSGRPDKFPSMSDLASDIHKTGVKAGIWIRPTALTTVREPWRLRGGPQPAPEKAIDLTIPENLELIRQDVHRMHGWGFDLIKHDFSTYDIFGRWGFEMGSDMTDPGWHFADRTLTNAEIILRLYRTIRDAAGDAVLIGCNTVGHLGAGLFELQRIGDDTSGRVWERTRKMGVNSLAFRLPQHKTLFATDADCVAHTEHTPWEKDRQFLDLVSRSGTPLFISVDPMNIAPEVQSAMTDAMQIALSGGCREVEPMDWLATTCPARWRFDDKIVTYDWMEPAGAWPLKC